jgi:hypothetical protein
MSRSRKILLVFIALAVLADFLPVTRDELSWWWVRSQNHADNYLDYLSDRPNGRHAAEARLAYDQRSWAETKRRQIRQAYTMATMATPTNAGTVADHRRELALKRDTFLWKQTTNGNTIASYNNYLQQYPEGLHAAEARQKRAVPGLPAGDANPQ